MTQSAFLPLKNCLAELTNTRTEDWFLFMRARHGMATVYQTLHNCFGQGTVTTQAYTCVTAVNPIVVAGLKPEYGDIDPDSIAYSAYRNKRERWCGKTLSGSSLTPRRSCYVRGFGTPRRFFWKTLLTALDLWFAITRENRWRIFRCTLSG